MKPNEFPALLLGQLDNKASSAAGSPVDRAGAVGSRNNTLMKLAGRLLNRGASPEEIQEALLAFNASFDTPLDQDEVQRVAQSILRYSPPPALTEAELASILARKIEGRVKFTTHFQGWLHYQGGRWQRDVAGARVIEATKAMIKSYADQIDRDMELGKEERGKLQASLNRMRRNASIKGVSSLVSTEPGILDEDVWEEPEMMLNFRNGTLELGTGRFRVHDPRDRLTKQLPYDFDPQATCPNFERTVASALNPEVARLLQQLFGYGLKGTGEQQRLAILCGSGRNGKSTIMDAVSQAFGDYAKTADPSTFMVAKNGKNISNDVAALAGARLISLSELNTGTKMDESLVKRMTGGEDIVARFLYQEGFSFKNRALIVLGTNMPPVFDGSDFAMARRFVMIKFEKVIAEDAVDQELPRKLALEKAGIMNWLLAGLRDYQENGLVIPAEVKAHTDAYVKDANQVLQFVEQEYLLTGNDKDKVPASVVFARYKGWASNGGLSAISRPAFVNAMHRTYPALGYRRTAQGYAWFGMQLLPKKIEP